MSCNSCAKSFSLLRQEKGCPGCGYSYCSKCLNNKVFLEKLSCEAKVCTKCKNKKNIDNTKISPPDAYYKRIGAIDQASVSKMSNNPTEQEIYERLKKLKETDKGTQKPTNDNQNIIERLQKLKGDIPSTSNAEIETRLANIKGVPISAVQSKPILPIPDTRTEQEQADDLLKQYVQQANIDNNYESEFNSLVSDIESRLQNLKGSSTKNVTNESIKANNDDSEDEEETIKKILAKVKAETVLDGNKTCDPVHDELPFCEICNEDANMRCLGCKYLFCKQCFIEHKDDDDGCNKYEPYTPPKSIAY